MAKTRTSFTKGHKKLGGRRKGVPNIVTLEHKQFCQKFLESSEYRQSAMKRMLKGKAPHLESLALGYAYGQPKRELEITTKRPTTFVLSTEETPPPAAQP